MFGDESQDIQVINNQNISLFNSSIVEFSINFDDGQARGVGKVNGGLFSSFITFTNPIGSVEVIIPISGTVGGREGDDQ